MYFTTSWDDNCIENEKLGNLLLTYGIKGTFYIDKPNNHVDIVKNLSYDFEIGAHSVSHPYLSRLSPLQQKAEITASKQALEALINKNIELFAYPYGDYNNTTIEILEASGFLFGRTVEKNNFYFKKVTRFEMPISFIFMPTIFERSRNPSNLLLVYRNRKNIKKIFSLPLKKIFSCRKTICYILEQFSGEIDFLHIYGHSWQIDDLNYWNDFAILLNVIKSTTGIKIVNNKELFEIMLNAP